MQLPIAQFADASVLFTLKKGSTMQTAKKGDTVLVNYVVRTTDGRVVGKTEDNDPAALTIGGAEIFPAVEAVLDGMEVGHEESVTVGVADAFGPRREDLIVEIPRAQLSGERWPQKAGFYAFLVCYRTLSDYFCSCTCCHQSTSWTVRPS